MNITLIGNPNSGKTTLFNLLTGTNQKTGNWPGVTVDKKQGICNVGNQQFNIIDLPGIYTVDDIQSTVDEQIARNYLLKNKKDIYLNIIDATNLDRGLYLTNQLREQGVQVIVILNMMDIANKLAIKIDTKLLSEKLATPVLTYSFAKDKDITNIITSVNNFKKNPNFNTKAINKKLNEEEVLLDAKYNLNKSKEIAKLVTKDKNSKFNLSDNVDKWVLGSWSGIIIFLLTMYLLFLFSINFGGALIDFFDIFSGVIFVDGLRYILESIGITEFLIVLLADGFGSGIQVVATFIPIIAFLYLFLTLLEEVGYIARAAFVMDKFMNKLGISGKSFIPLIIGFGCNVPGIMSTRTLDSQKQRITTVLMSPFMSCGARLTVYALFASVFFASGGQNIVFLLYLIGIIFAIITAMIMKKALLQDEESTFIMELPTYNIPSFRNIIINTWNKLKGFALSAGKIIVIVVALINIANNIGIDGSFGNQNSDKSILSVLSQKITPVFAPMGIKQDNWPATVGIITGLLAKEVVVGTLNALYSDIAQKDKKQEITAEEFNLLDNISEAFATIPTNFYDAIMNISDPLGFGILEDAKTQAIFSETQEVDLSTLKAIVQYFDGKVGAFAYLLFILLYFPCVAATGAMYRETGKNWAIVGVTWSTMLAYVVSVVFYQTATFSQHQLQSSIWIITLLSLLLISIYIFIKKVKKLDIMKIPVIMDDEGSSCSHC